VIIDTDKLKDAVSAYFAKKAVLLDSIKGDSVAIKRLTANETQEIKVERTIADVESLWNQYFS
jgi:hypothetical protein